MLRFRIMKYQLLLTQTPQRQEQVNGRAALQDIDTDTKLMRLVASESTNTDGALPAGSQTLGRIFCLVSGIQANFKTH